MKLRAGDGVWTERRFSTISLQLLRQYRTSLARGRRDAAGTAWAAAVIGAQDRAPAVTGADALSGVKGPVAQTG